MAFGKEPTCSPVLLTEIPCPTPTPTFLGGMWLLLNLPLGHEQNWAGVGRDSNGVGGGQFLLELRGPVKLARPCPGTSQRADHCGQGHDHKLITCQKGGAKSS